MKNKIRTLFLLFAVLAMPSCKQNEVAGIKIEHGLYVHQDYSTNRKLCYLIEDALEKDKEAIKSLITFPCGGGAGCYDLGFIITQIIHKIGDKQFAYLVIGFNSKQKIGLRSLVRAGLEYGDNDANGKMDDFKIEKEFPELNGVLEVELTSTPLMKSMDCGLSAIDHKK